MAQGVRGGYLIGIAEKGARACSTNQRGNRGFRVRNELYPNKRDRVKKPVEKALKDEVRRRGRAPGGSLVRKIFVHSPTSGGSIGRAPKRMGDFEILEVGREIVAFIVLRVVNTDRQL